MSDIDLTQDERKVLELLGKLHVSQSKNINEATIRKKLPSKYHKNLHETIKSLPPMRSTSTSGAAPDSKYQ
jgi:hypothetical protein